VRDSFTELDTFTVPEVMERLRVGRHKVYDLFRSRELPSIKIGNSRRVPATALAAYMAHRIQEDN
jgi:excisionase family DNA binding protein